MIFMEICGSWGTIGNLKTISLMKTPLRQDWIPSDLHTGIQRTRLGGFFGSKPYHLDFESRFGYVPSNMANVNTFRLVRTSF